MRRIALSLLALIVAGTLSAAQPATARAGGDNAAVAINTKDGASIFKFAFAIRRVAGDVVDQTNAAVAYSSCTDCQTVAIAIEIVLITGDPSIVTPTNVAIAINYQCNLCITVADAYQFILSPGGEVHFSPHGMQEIRRIVGEIRDLGKQDLSAADIQARLEQLVQQLAEVVTSELVASGQSGQAPPAPPPAPPPSPPPPQTTGSTSTTQPETTTSTTSTTTVETTTTPSTTTTTP